MQRADCCVDEIRALSENVKKIKRKQYCWWNSEDVKKFKKGILKKNEYEKLYLLALILSLIIFVFILYII